MHPINIWPPPPTYDSVTTASPSLKERKAAKYGWIGAILAVFGVLLPTFVFDLWIRCMDSILDHPDMDDWYIGDGKTDLYLCLTVIISLELAAFAFGVRGRQTVVGKIVFLIVAAALCFACIVMPDLYWLDAHFN